MSTACFFVLIVSWQNPLAYVFSQPGSVWPLVSTILKVARDKPGREKKKKKESHDGYKELPSPCSFIPSTGEWAQVFSTWKLSLRFALCPCQGHSFPNICSAFHHHIRSLLKHRPLHEALLGGTFKMSNTGSLSPTIPLPCPVVFFL